MTRKRISTACLAFAALSSLIFSQANFPIAAYGQEDGSGLTGSNFGSILPSSSFGGTGVFHSRSPFTDKLNQGISPESNFDAPMPTSSQSPFPQAPSRAAEPVSVERAWYKFLEPSLNLSRALEESERKRLLSVVPMPLNIRGGDRRTEIRTALLRGDGAQEYACFKTIYGSLFGRGNVLVLSISGRVVRVLNLNGREKDLLFKLPNGQIITVGPGTEMIISRSLDPQELNMCDGIARRGFTRVMKCSELQMAFCQFSHSTVMELPEMRFYARNPKNLETLMATVKTLDSMRGTTGFKMALRPGERAEQVAKEVKAAPKTALLLEKSSKPSEAEIKAKESGKEAEAARAKQIARAAELAKSKDAARAMEIAKAKDIAAAAKAKELAKAKDEAAKAKEIARIKEEAAKAKEIAKAKEEAAKASALAKAKEEAARAQQTAKAKEAARQAELARAEQEAQKVRELAKAKEEARKAKEIARAKEEALKAEIKKQKEEEQRAIQAAEAKAEAERAAELAKAKEEARKARELAKKQKEEEARAKEIARQKEEAVKAAEIAKAKEEAAKAKQAAIAAAQAEKQAAIAAAQAAKQQANEKKIAEANAAAARAKEAAKEAQAKAIAQAKQEAEQAKLAARKKEELAAARRTEKVRTVAAAQGAKSPQAKNIADSIVEGEGGAAKETAKATTTAPAKTKAALPGVSASEAAKALADKLKEKQKRIVSFGGKLKENISAKMAEVSKPSPAAPKAPEPQVTYDGPARKLLPRVMPGPDTPPHIARLLIYADREEKLAVSLRKKADKCIEYAEGGMMNYDQQKKIMAQAREALQKAQGAEDLAQSFRRQAEIARTGHDPM